MAKFFGTSSPITIDNNVARPIPTTAPTTGTAPAATPTAASGPSSSRLTAGSKVKPVNIDLRLLGGFDLLGERGDFGVHAGFAQHHVADGHRLLAAQDHLLGEHDIGVVELAGRTRGRARRRGAGFAGHAGSVVAMRAADQDDGQGQDRRHQGGPNQREVRRNVRFDRVAPDSWSAPWLTSAQTTESALLPGVRRPAA